MKILILTENFAPAWAFGGPPKKLFEIVLEITRRGHHVTVFATNVLDAWSEIKEKHRVIRGVEVYYLKTLSKWLAWYTKIFLPIGLRKMLKENIKNFDLVLLSSSRTIFSLLGYHYARKFGKPYVLLPYGSLPRGTGIKKIVKCAIDPVFGYRTLRNASAVFAQTEHEIQEAKKYGAKDALVKLVPLNIDLSEFEDLPPKGGLRRKFGIETREKMILFLGRVHKYKGLDLLIKSFSHLRQIGDNCRLVIVGRDDGYLYTVFKLIKYLKLEGKVIFAGPLYEKDRLEAYVDADVFVMPSSQFEETSTAALEACATSTPVIVTKQASIPGLDKHEAGFTINYDQKELEDALLRILNDEELRVKMGENARKMVEETFSLTRVVDRFEEVFRSIVEGSLR
jgi:glycosyltransferase involved in cell wall biosynthesis